jgi:hypothetical protein
VRMRLRLYRLGGLLAALILVSGCQTTISTGDAIPSVTFGGRGYVVVSGDGFNLDRGYLTKLGLASKTSLHDQDAFIYSLAGIEPGRAAVAYDGGQVVLLVERQFFQALPTVGSAGTDPLADGLPELCAYWLRPPSNCP